MNFKKQIITLGMLLFSAVLFGQNGIEPATVSSVVPLGSFDFAILERTGTNEYYKSGLYAQGVISINQSVALDFATGGIETPVLIASNLTETVHCHLLQNNGQFIPQVGLPTLDNDILFFSDENHFHDYYNEIDQFLSGDVDEDIVLDQVEGQFSGYTSYRTYFINKHNWHNGEFTEQQLDDLYAEDFLNNVIYKMMLNEHREVGIGNTVYYIHSKEVVIAVPRTNQWAIDILRDLEDGGNTYTSTIMESNAFQFIEGGIQSRAAIYVDNPSSDPMSFSYNFTTAPVVGRIGCDLAYINIQFLAEQRPFGGTWEEVDPTEIGIRTLEINWGDGTPVQIFPVHYGTETIDHVYEIWGTFDITTKYTFSGPDGTTYVLEDGAGTGGADLEVNVGGICTDVSDEEYGWENIGNLRLTAKLWAHKFWIIKELGSHSHGYKKNGSGLWELNKCSRIFTEANGDFNDGSCVFKDDYDPLILKTNKKKVQKSEFKLWHHYYTASDDIRSSHYLIEDGVTIDFGLRLNPCVW